MSLFYVKGIMKNITFLIFFLNCPFLWANNNNELGRSLANYDACAQVSLAINDQQMFFYYKKMLNDISLSALSLTHNESLKLYEIWMESEKVLMKLNISSMEKLCSSRFDELSRKMLNQ
jgi:hypothetical protein